MSSNFVHLHLHSQYSLLDGACRIRDIVSKAKTLGMPAVAMTDHGNLFGVLDFYEEAKAQEIKPIIGCEVYVSPTTRFDKSPEAKTAHLVLLAANNEGYANLMKLVSFGYLEGFYYKPRIDKDVLAQYSKGLIGLSACLKGEVAQKLMAGKYDEARALADQYHQILGPGNFYLEVMDHGLMEQKRVNEGMLALSKDLALPLVATNDVHYLEPEHYEAHEALLCIQTQTTMLDPKRMRMNSDQFYFKTQDEMSRLFAWAPEALRNTGLIAERCHLDFKFGAYHVPEFVSPTGETKDVYLRNLCLAGIDKRFGGPTEDILKRLDYELDVIGKLGFLGYFLIVWDFIRYAKEQGIAVGPGRGSAAGSLVSYLLEITDLDPIKYQLYFERFLNSQRASMPDIDIDFCVERREEVIEYVAKKYGRENVAQIITFGTMQAKAAVRDVARALSMPYADADRIAKLIPNELHITLDEALDAEPQLRQLMQQDETTRRVLDIARVLEGLSRHASVHAAGVVISDKPLTEYVPLYKADEQITTAFTMKGIEKIGLLKMDFLGLKTLTLLQDAVRIIKRRTGRDIDMRNLPLDDKKTYDLLGRGESAGVFQLESGGMKDLLRRIKATNIEDVISILALYRPGPMQSGMMDDFIARKRGEKPIVYQHPKLETVLQNTYGVAIYQEQVMNMACVLAGFTLVEADNLRRAMSKKKADVMQKMRATFVAGCLRNNNIPEDEANRLFDTIDYFSGYGFNRSHSAAYALVSYQTAWLKANFPVEFMCALLTNEKDNIDKIVEYITEARAMKLKVLPPDVNESHAVFSVVNPTTIRYGLLGVKNIGAAAIEELVAEREKNGPFSSIFDFCKRVDTRTNNRKVIESLIKCGAFDSFKVRRSQMAAALDEALSSGTKVQREQEVGQVSFFSMGEENGGFSKRVESFADIKEWPQPQLLAFEKELLGFYLSGHPLERYQIEIKTFTNATTQKLRQMNEGAGVVMIALINRVKLTSTKKTGDRMAILGIEDLHGAIEAIVFPKAYQKVSQSIKDGVAVVVKGTVTLKEDSPKIFVDDLRDINEIYRLIRMITLDMTKASLEKLTQVKKKLEQFPGNVPVHIQIDAKNHRSVEIKVGRDLYVTPSEVLMDEIKSIVGDGCFRVVL